MPLSLMRIRTKSGCLTCKDTHWHNLAGRRIKCDEAKPNCLKCSSTGRKCDGYETLTPPRLDARLRSPFNFPQNLQFSTGELETRSFHFFYERTVPSLAGYCGSQFWSGLVLQVSQHEKSVWHALIALGSLHENFEKDQQVSGFWFSRHGHDRFALQEYISAIRALLESSCSSSRAIPSYPVGDSAGRLSVDVCLITCILFVFIEIMSSRYISAIGHVRSGIKILDEVYYDQRSGTFHHTSLKPSTVSSLEMENLRKILVRLQDQTLTLTRSDMDKPLFKEAARYAEIPNDFSSIAEAHDTFEYLLAWFYHEYRQLVDTKPGDMASEAHNNLFRRSEEFLKRWSNALDKFEQSRGMHMTYKERMGLKILRMNQQYKQFVLLDRLVMGRTDPSSWDMYNSMFEDFVSQASSILEMADTPAHPYSSPTLSFSESRDGRHRPSFSLDMGIIAPLYDIATLCRDPSIRRRAVDILRSSSRQEGLLNSHACAVVAEKVIALEETVALKGGVVNDPEVLASVAPLILEPVQQQQQSAITRCFEVPEAARFPFAYPNFDTVNSKAFLTIGVARETQVQIPLPAMTAMMDNMER